MANLTALKLVLAVLGGAATVATVGGFLWSWHSRGQEIEILETRLANRDITISLLEDANGAFKTVLERQREALRQMQSHTREIDEAATLAAERAENRKEKADQEIESILSAESNAKTEIERCRDARLLLVR